MKIPNFIQDKQVAWAKRNNLKIVRSQVEIGKQVYLHNLNDNFFIPLYDEVIASIREGDGGELNFRGKTLPKMQALHSSSVLGINVFQYWREKGNVSDIAYALGFCAKENRRSTSIEFEEKFEISPAFDRSPNIDVVIHNSEKNSHQVYAVECKFTEPYSSNIHSGLSDRYLLEIDKQWEGIPNLHKLAKQISPDDKQFKYLHAAQLIKHILGLKNQYGKTKFRLMYLFYDAFGAEGCQHREEIERFKRVTDLDKIKFHALSYQELILTLTKHFYVGNEEYLHYMTERYL